jgi:hypothetical protein
LQSTDMMAQLLSAGFAKNDTNLLGAALQSLSRAMTHYARWRW